MPGRPWVLWAAAYVLWLVLLLGAPSSAAAHWPTLTGRASVFGNDPFQGFVDGSDTGITALGHPTSWGGIAVYRRSTLGGYWKVCAPRQILAAGVRRCHTIKQSDLGPAPWTGRIVDVTAVTARRAWHLTVSGFPTDESEWTLAYKGRRPHH